MTRDEKRTIVIQLLAEGFSQAEIARQFGVTGSTVSKWVNLETARAREKQINARRGSAKRAWENEHDRGTCPCGAPMSVGSQRKGYKLCASCRREVERTGRVMREERIAELWEAGATIREVAAAMDCTPGAIGMALTRMRHAGWDIPYRNDWTPESLARVTEATRRLRAAERHERESNTTGES